MSDDQKTVPMPASLQKAFTIYRRQAELFQQQVNENRGNGSETFALMIAKAASNSIAERSRGVSVGIKPHPFNMSRTADFMSSNPHHSTCIQTKVESTIGQGWVTEESKKRLASGDTRIFPLEESRVDTILDPLCDVSFDDTLNPICSDFFENGGGLMEVKRAAGTVLAPIVGLHPIHHTEAHIEVERPDGTRHWSIRSTEGYERKFALFGDLDDFLERNDADPEETSEVIYFRQRSRINEWYGYPKWIAAVAAIELKQALMQERFDFYLNRGVPEFFIFFLGAKMTPKQWEAIENAMKSNVGVGNFHKSLAMNFENTDPNNFKIQMEQLRQDSQEGEYTGMNDATAMDIVTAHRVPPALAGILIPGKMGASNELVNSIMAFQLLVINGAQRIFQQTLRTTLGNPALNGGLALTAKDFTLNRITDQFNLQNMDTVARMRDSASQGGRDISQGLKD